MKYTAVIGMEIHAELKTKTKMFCSCENGYELKEKPNENICPVCLAHPGMLPVINEQAIDWTILIGLALNCKINNFTKFDRKNYFYPDLPKGYQISQYDLPINYDGHLNVNGRDISIIRIHLEEDTGKLIHSGDKALVDLSRAGTPLIELVTGPVITGAKEAADFCREYQKILRYLEISDADMEKGQMRCEANISLQEAGKFVIENNEVKPLLNYKLNPKTELKNINSFKAVEKAIEYEIKRQTKILEAGADTEEKLIQETRGWDETTGTTFRQRVKETAADYRYFPEPDLPPLVIDEKKIEELRGTLPELPATKLRRFVSEYQFNPEIAEIITDNKNLAAYAEQVYSELVGWLVALPETEGTAEEIIRAEGKKLAKLIGNWLVTHLFKHLNENKVEIANCPITPENFAEFLTLIYHNKINNLSAQELLTELFKTNENPIELMEKKNLGQLSNNGELETIIEKIITENPKAVEDFKAGKEASFKFLVGMAMRETKGKANPQIINDLLIKKLS